MTISELIAVLDGIMDEHGDLPVEDNRGTEAIGVKIVLEQGRKLADGEKPKALAVTVQ